MMEELITNNKLRELVHDGDGTREHKTKKTTKIIKDEIANMKKMFAKLRKTIEHQCSLL